MLGNWVSPPKETPWILNQKNILIVTQYHVPTICTNKVVLNAHFYLLVLGGVAVSAWQIEFNIENISLVLNAGWPRFLISLELDSDIFFSQPALPNICPKMWHSGQNGVVYLGHIACHIGCPQLYAKGYWIRTNFCPPFYHLKTLLSSHADWDGLTINIAKSFIRCKPRRYAPDLRADAATEC